MTQEQIEKMAKSLRKSCLQKIDVSEDKVNGMSKGQFPSDDENLKCYTTCIMKALRTFKNGEIDFGMVIKQLDITMPPESASLVKEVVNSCQKLEAGEFLFKLSLSLYAEYTGDDCNKTYELIKCYYFTNPEIFFFP
ncbi:hypothetical protein E2986_00579 [Frieseomelitta varia]|uniref:Uncharacterized protein n=1 Tax=Frieseomelitta varia TaxID=561572 RepID=A0A833R7H4_9HYME|nr:hypothetical protein E2986_00579 [Frieseomelitta varia]